MLCHASSHQQPAADHRWSTIPLALKTAWLARCITSSVGPGGDPLLRPSKRSWSHSKSEPQSSPQVSEASEPQFASGFPWIRRGLLQPARPSREVGAVGSALGCLVAHPKRKAPLFSRKRRSLFIPSLEVLTPFWGAGLGLGVLVWWTWCNKINKLRLIATAKASDARIIRPWCMAFPLQGLMCSHVDVHLSSIPYCAFPSSIRYSPKPPSHP